MKRIIFFLFVLVLSLFSFNGIGAESNAIKISGLVKQPLNIGIEDLERFQTVRVQLNEVMKDKTYKGAFYYQGVALRTLLDTADIEKKFKTVSKNIDLAVKISNKEGKSIVLSWGEVYYRNSGDIIIATSATPIMPHKSCASCHKEDTFYKPYLDVLSRDIEFPKLVVGSDGYAERSIEGVVSIEIIDPAQNLNIKGDSSAKLSSPSFKITGLVKRR